MSTGGAKPNSQQGGLDNMVKELFGQTRPVRNDLFTQLSEALRTGGVGARIPIISRAVEDTKAAGSKALTQTDESLARLGLSGTPFGENIRAQTRLSSENAVNRVPTDYAQHFIDMAPALVSGQTGQAMSGAGTSAYLTNQSNMNELNANVELMKAMFQGGASLGSSGGTVTNNYGY